MIRKWIGLGLLLFTAAAQAQMQPAQAPREPMPMATFARLADTEQVRINTDGTALATRIRVNGESYLAVIPLDQPNPRPQIVGRDGEFDRVEDVRTTGWDWIDPDNLIIHLASRTDLDGERVDATRLIAYNRTTRQITRLGWEGTFVSSRLLWISQSGPPRVRIARYAAGRGTERLFNEEVIEVDVVTGRQRVVEPPRRGVRNWYADGDGNVRLGVEFDRATGRLQALYRSDGEGQFRTILRERSERYSEAHVPVIFLPGEKALVRTRHGGFTALHEIDLTTMEIGRRVFGVDGYDIAGVDSNDAGNALERATVVRDRTEHFWFDPRMGEIQQALDETFGAGRAAVISTDRPRVNIVVHVGGPDQAGAYYLYNTSSGNLRHAGWRNSQLRDMRLNPVRTIRYRASDGQTIAAVLTLPRLRESRSLPLIVLPHGGPWVRDEESWDWMVQPLAELGYAVIQPNYRGSGGFGQAWEAMSDGNWGTRMQDDLNDAVDHLAREGIADPRRVCMFGWSYGGYASARAAQRDAQRYRCAIAGAGVYDLPMMVTFDRNYLGRYGSQYIGSAAGRLADVSPGRHTDGRWAPILIVHGRRDERVPVAQARTLVSQLRGSGKVEGRDFVYIEQERNTHNLPLEADRLQLLEEMRRFLARHNPAS